MLTSQQTLYALELVLVILQCIHITNAINTNNDQIIGDFTKHSVCITDKFDTISSFYNELIYDPRFETKDEQHRLLCNNRSIWISQDTKFVIYYQLFTDSMISYNENIAGFGIFECSQDSYLAALKAQSMDIVSNNLCVDPISIYPDSYPGKECNGKPLVYCLPFKDQSKCPQFQMTMNSMYNKIDPDTDLVEIDNFFECECWYKVSSEGGTNNDERMSINLNFNENCVEIQKEKKLKEDEESEKMLSHQQNEMERRAEDDRKEEEKESKDEIELEKNREFSILWATLGFIIGVISLIMFVIYACRKQYHKKMYLTSRKYMRETHFGDVENVNLMGDDTDSSDTQTNSELSDTQNGSTLADTESDCDTDLSTELAYDKDGENGAKALKTSANDTAHTAFNPCKT